MKRIFIFIMIISIAFSLASCNYADPSGSIDPNKEVADDNREEANDNQNNQTEHNDLETDIIIDIAAEYVARSMETFLLDFEQNATVRDLFFYQYDMNNGLLLKDLPSVNDTIIIPKLKTDSFICRAIYADASLYGFSYLPSNSDRTIGAEVYGGFIIYIRKTPDLYSDLETSDLDLEFFEDYAYNKRSEYLILNEDGQQVEVRYDENALNLNSRAAIEELITFERYGFNENGLYLIPEE